MSLLFETIKFQNGKLHNLDLHNARLNKSRSEIFGCKDTINLAKSIHLPETYDNGVYKCKVIYARKIEHVEFLTYTIKPVATLRMVEHDDIEYNHKYVNRKCFDNLLDNADADDILIVKRGFITDSSYANIVFYDGRKWITPSTPLLRGTKREKLLKEKLISEQPIKKDDLHLFSRAILINAMIDMEDSPVIKIRNIF